MEKRLIFAVALSILVLVFFQFVFGPPVSVENNGKSEVNEKNSQISEKYEYVEQKKKTKEKGNKKDFILPTHLENEYFLETEKLYIKFSNLGAQINEVLLKKYKKSENNDLWPLFQAKSGEIGIGKLFFDEKKTGKFQIWQAREQDNGIVFTLDLEEGLKIIKKFAIVSPYSISLSISVENKNNSAKEFEYYLFGTSNVYRPSRLDKRYSNVVISYKKDKVDRISLRKIEEGLTEEPGDFEWIAEKSSYFSMIFVPREKIIASVFYKGNDEFIAVGAKAFPSIVNANSITKDIYDIYMGPNDSVELEKFNPGCGQLVNFGFFNPISKFLLKILRFIYSIVHNYGISIILLTLIINLCLSPLTLKSLTSMKKMQSLQPHISKLREEHKEDPKKLNREIMNLYKEHGGNPLGGCFPMLLQFPIFISLYLALTKSIELKGASFLWISDLAAPDAAFKLAFSLPFIGKNINILPILMLFAMFIQQKISQQKNPMQGGPQKQMAIIMPIVFGFIFYHFPSGLVLYWLTNTIVMSLVNWKILGKD